MHDTCMVPIFYYIILVEIEKVRGLLLKACEEVILLGKRNRLSSRDSDDIGNNMGRFYLWGNVGRKEGTVVTNGVTDNARTARRISNFNRSLQPTRLCSSFTWFRVMRKIATSSRGTSSRKESVSAKNSLPSTNGLTGVYFLPITFIYMASFIIRNPSS